MSQQTCTRNKARSQDRGAVVLLFALSIVVLLGVGAFVIDLGNARQSATQVQNASDAAVLAGAQDLPANGSNQTMASVARTIAASYGAATFNGAPTSSSGCSSVGPDTACFAVGPATIEITSPHLGNSQQIYAEVCQPTDTFFAGAIGKQSPTVCRSAVAEVSLVNSGSPAILALHPTACGAINTHGSGTILAVGTIQVNSSSNCALTQEGANSELISDSCVCVVGGAQLQYAANASPAVTPGASVAPDPYAGVPDIAQPGQNGQRSGNTYSPGYYSSQIKIEGTGTYTFQPGIYYLNSGLRLEGTASVVADNVLFYIANGRWDMGSGPHDVRISGLGSSLDPSNQYMGLAVFQARSNSNDLLYGDDTFAGVRSGDTCAVTASSGIDGGIYIPNGRLNIRGNDSTLCAARPIVADTFKVEEASTLAGSAAQSSGPATPVVSLVQ